MVKFKYYLVLLFCYYYYSLCNCDSVETTTVADSWIKILSVASEYLVNCSSSEKTNTLIPWRCIRNGSLRIFDQITDCDVIPVWDNMILKRYRQNKNHKQMISKSFIDFRKNNKKLVTNTPPESWSQHILKRLVDTLETHALEIDLSEPGTADEARNRRRHQMLPMMIFGITAFGMVIVPIGFQFLAVIAGKALLLAKMALLLSSINGLKRVATSGVSYGFYRAPHLYGSDWDRMGTPPDSGPR